MIRSKAGIIHRLFHLSELELIEIERKLIALKELHNANLIAKEIYVLKNLETSKLETFDKLKKQAIKFRTKIYFKTYPINWIT